MIADGINVVIDICDLKEAHDLHAFMEKMVTDPVIAHVLIVCDKVYTEKANTRATGAGAESQIIPSEIYNKTEQIKFIPIVSEYDAVVLTGVGI